MSDFYLIGDVHGQTGTYLSRLKDLPEEAYSLQVGDMGLGFRGVGLPPPGRALPKTDRHKFIRGNHDDPTVCREHPWYAGDYGYWPEFDLFYLGGAWSIDKAGRTPGVSWWPDEELGIVELNTAMDLYLKVKPKVVVTHEAPSCASLEMLMGLIVGRETLGYKMDRYHTRTSQVLQQMLEAHPPKEWYFGHYHVNKDFFMKGTNFHCVAELNVKKLEFSA